MAYNNLVYLSYGSEIEYRRAVFSILSFFSWCKSGTSSIRIVVYTDNPDFFHSFLSNREIEYVLLTKEVLNEMLGGTGLIHRRKIAVIDLTFQRYPEDDLLFLDSDTFFFSSPKILLDGFGSGKSIMHKREYSLKEAPSIFGLFNQGHFPEAFLNHINNKTFEIADNKETFSEEDSSWNAGVIGLYKDFAKYIPDIYNLTDDFYAHSGWFVSEQLAFSLVLQRKTNISSSDNFILHYWGKRQKELLDSLLFNLLRSSGTITFDESFIKSLTLKWNKKVADDLILEQAVIALSNNSWLYGLKKSLRIMFRNPFDKRVYMEILGAVKTDPS